MGGHGKPAAPALPTKPKKTIPGLSKKVPYCCERYLHPDTISAGPSVEVQPMPPRPKIIVKTHMERVYVP